MNAKQIHRIRAALAFGLRANGASFEDIALVLKAGSKEKARQLVGRGTRATPKPDILSRLRKTWGGTTFSAEQVKEMREAELE